MDAVTLALAKKHTNEQVIQKATNSPVEEISFDGGIYSVGNNVVNGQVSVTLKGRSLKNELNYNRETWAQWVVLSSGIIKDSSGISISEGSKYVYIPTKVKPLTKYGLLYNIVENSITEGGIRGSNYLTGSYITLSSNLGNNTKTFITHEVIDLNRFGIETTSTTVGSIKIKDFRLFELPTGSEIEADFETLTADELAQKYPYINGDSVKSTNSVRIRNVNEDETKESIAYVNLPQGEELRSLPNGVMDEIRVSEGKLIKRISDWIQWNGLFITSIYTGYSNIDLVSFTRPSDFVIASASGLAIVQGMSEYTSSSGTDSLDNIGKFTTSLVDNRLDLIIAKGTFTTMQEAINYYNTKPIILNYQLAEPIVTKLPAQPPLQIYENGTVYVEHLGDPAETTLPTVELTVPIASGNKVGIATHDYAGEAADWVLSSNENKCEVLVVSNAGADAYIIAKDRPGQKHLIKNTTDYNITIKKAEGSGVTITTGQKARVQHLGEDFEEI